MHQDDYLMSDRTSDSDRSAHHSAHAEEHWYRVCNYTCLVRSEDAGAAALVDRFLRPFASHPQPGCAVFELTHQAPESVLLTVDGKEMVRSGSISEALMTLLFEVNRKGIASVDDLLAFHAGSLSWRGAGIALPGPSGSGKSTLTAGLTVAGCGYLSDEMALVELETGTLHPYHRPLWLSHRSVGLIPGLADRLPAGFVPPKGAERPVPPDALRPLPFGSPCELRLVIAPEHHPGAPTVLEPIRRSEAVVALIGNAFNFRRFGREGLHALARLAPRVSAYRLQMGDLRAAVELVLRTLENIGAEPSAAGPAPAVGAPIARN